MAGGQVWCATAREEIGVVGMVVVVVVGKQVGGEVETHPGKSHPRVVMSRELQEEKCHANATSTLSASRFASVEGARWAAMSRRAVMSRMANKPADCHPCQTEPAPLMLRVQTRCRKAQC